MHLSFISAILAVSGSTLVSAATIPSPSLAPKLPLSAFNTTAFRGITLEQALTGSKPDPNLSIPPSGFKIQASCANPRVRVEWDSYSNADRQAFVDGIKCLLNKPASGRFSQARNRYEDLVALHQNLTPNVHNNAKFLIWHRYYLWAFEDMLRTECGFNGAIPWFDETKYSGRFAQSSIFSDQWFGAIALGGNCVTNGQFARLTLNVGPGTGNGAHCLARNDNGQLTANANSQIVNACNSRGDYADMAGCAETGAHAWGHNGIGAVMADAAASPGDPVFFLHHAFIDRNYRIWQNQDPARVTYINGQDRFGNNLNLDTGVSLGGLRNDVKIRDIINTLDNTLCYKYNY
ncbi:Di-copper centre-containing protein [Delitschia confertaspora ATCC 74209]|uniref:Di-copper centre-containing protein n=1 Tax=Delitschia confertaspora ATCC 74209 TaxID=1513339 RepID=A0A9P4MQK5_9PLEO|nr:Di-copper centre-containing protein [Delitschia confertaspora ATCC 74209]